MTPAEVAARLAVLQALDKRLKAAKDTARAAALGLLDAGDRKTASLPDGTGIGSVTVVAGRRTAKVHDETALLAWVREHAPTEVVEQVRESYLTKLLDGCKKAGAAVDPATGEAIPGVTVSEGEPYPNVTQSPDQAEQVAAAWRDGQVLLGGLLQLDPGGAQ